MKPTGVAALLVGFILMASSVHAQSTPSLNLEGTGDLGPGPGACVVGTSFNCPISPFRGIGDLVGGNSGRFRNDPYTSSSNRQPDTDQRPDGSQHRRRGW
jgi:hypothetical protein